MDDKTPMVDELEKGPWPSYVKELRKAAKKSDAVKDLIVVQERSFEEKMTL